MTTTPQLLSDDDIEAEWVLTPQRQDGNDFVLFARRIESAILAKLQASPQAQPEQAAQGVGEVVHQAQFEYPSNNPGVRYDVSADLLERIPVQEAGQVASETPDPMDHRSETCEVCQRHRTAPPAHIPADVDEALTTQHAQTPPSFSGYIETVGGVPGDLVFDDEHAQTKGGAWLPLFLNDDTACHSQNAESDPQPSLSLTDATQGAAVPALTPYDMICEAIGKADDIIMGGLDSDDCVAVVRTMQALIETIGINGLTVGGKRA